MLPLAILVAAAAAVPWDLALAPASEPGRKLVVSGVVRKKAGLPPLAGVNVYAYHADGNGLYARKGEEAKGPRLAGTLRTGPDGRYRLRTVFPGTYGGPPHVHLEVWGKGIPRCAFVINLAAPAFADSKSPDSSWIDRAISGRRSVLPGLLVPFRDTQGVLHVTYDLLVNSGYPVPK